MYKKKISSNMKTANNILLTDTNRTSVL